MTYQWPPPGGSARGPRGVMPEQALLRVERVQQREEVVLVGASAVQENERACRLAR